MRRLVGPARVGVGLLLIACGGFVLATTGSTTPSVGAAARVDDRPNIVLIMTDDETVQDMAWMPKTQALLGANGITFEGLSPHPLCCPARAEVLTGQYAHNNGVYTNVGRTGGYHALRDPDNTVGSWLQQAGYRTGFVGKFLNGYQWAKHGRPGGWDYWDALTKGTYAYYGYKTVNNGKLRQAPPGEYITDYVASVTRDRIREWAGSDQPFFLWASYVAPHDSCTPGACMANPIPEEDYRHAYPTARNPARKKPSYNERNVTDKPHSARLRVQKKKTLQGLFLARIRSLASVDDAVAETVQTLADSGELDNTTIIFTSDNGYLLGEHRRIGKRQPYEESVRVPMLARGPGFESSGASGQLASMLDLTPTFLELARATPGRVLDGRSLVGLSGVPSPDDRMTRLIQSGHDAWHKRGRLWDWRGVRERRYTFVHWSYGFVELYDRLRDPYELTNRADDPRYRKVLMAMRARFEALRSCAGTTECYVDFGPPPDPARLRR